LAIEETGNRHWYEPLPGAYGEIGKGFIEAHHLRPIATLERLHHWVSLRRGARGKAGPLDPKDYLLMAEIVWDLAADALQAKKAQEAARHAKQDPLGLDHGQSATVTAGPLRSFAAARSSGSTSSGLRGAIRWLSHLAGAVVMAHHIQLLTVADYADEQLIVQTNDRVG
jgi:hypothetical protein